MKPLLALTPEEMHRAGYAVVDRIVAHFETLDAQSPWGAGEAPAPNPFDKPLRREPGDIGEALKFLDEHLFPYCLRVNHSQFYSFVPGPSNYIGVLGDALAAGFNIFSGTWIGSSGGAELERAMLNRMRDALGLPETAGGLFTSGGSMANVIALAAARQAKLGGDMSGALIYASDQAHSAVERGLRLLGFRSEQYRKIGSDKEFRLNVAALHRAIEEDRACGLRPFCVVATPGTTNTGAVDPLNELADLCEQEGLWLHADGAYGACAAFSPRGKPALAGIERVHSVSFDPHKWLFQPFEIGGVLVRDAALLHDAFDISAEYLRDTKTKGRALNFYQYGPQLTRSQRALKLWLTFEVYGADAVAEAIDNGFRMAEHAQSLIETSPCWRLVSAASMAVVSFRAAPEGWPDDDCDRLTSAVAEASRREGRDVVLTTELGGRVCLRLCTINPRIEEADIAATLARLTAHCEALAGAGMR